MRKNLRKTFYATTALALTASMLFSGSAWANVRLTMTPKESLRAAALKDASVLSLSFEDDLKDSSSKKNDGTAVGSVSYGTGVNGKSLLLTGNGYVDLGTSKDLQSSKMTVSFWLKAPKGGLKGEQMIMWNKADGKWYSDGWYMGSASDSRPLELSLGASAAAEGQPYKCFVSGDRSKFFPEGEWVHIAVTYDSATKQAVIYRNGVAQTTGTEYEAEAGVIKGTEDKKWLGSNSPKYGAKSAFEIDEYEIYSECATPEDVKELYTKNGGKIDTKALIESDYDALTVSDTASSDLSLPVSGTAGGSKITWTSSDEKVINKDGKVTRPSFDTGNVTVTLTATLVNGEETMTKTFGVKVLCESDMADLAQFPLTDVTVTDEYEANSFQKDVDYLTSIDVDRMLAGFRETAAYAAGYSDEKRQEFMKNTTRYAGWENSLIGSHTMGHYLSAMAQAYVNPAITAKDKEKVGTMLNEIIDGLKECQELTKDSKVCKEGYIFGATIKNKNNLEAQFDNVEKGQANIVTQAWVPWYTMHKILAGVVDVYEITGNKTALEVADKLGDWVANRTSSWSASTQATVLNIEYGGMNDCMYELYKNTKKESHAESAHMFDETKLFEKIKKGGKNLVDGIHANTTIPKFLGALNRYRTLGESEKVYLEYAQAFWDYVINNHTYITGGNSEDEHFGADNVLDKERTNVNNETCNTYNMLKLSRELFKITGDKKYSDYYENTLINAILPSQNPATGMTMYFQPMASGYQKVFGTPYDCFWCCTGTGMENFTKLNDSIYYKKNNTLIVTQYTSSVLEWKEKNVQIVQEADLSESDTAQFTVNTTDGKDEADITLRLRLPEWTASKPEITVDGKAYEYEEASGYATVKGAFANGTKITIKLPMEVRAYNLPDGEDTYAFKYGPFVLSAKLGADAANQTTGSHGVSVTVPTTKAVDNDRISIKNAESVADYMKNINENLVKADGKLEFSLAGTDKSSYTFVPHYSQYKENYGIYWKFAVDADGYASDVILAEKNDKRFESAKLDAIEAGYGQYEIGLLEDNSVGDSAALTRYAKAGGYFQYDMMVDTDSDNYLLVTFAKEDDGKPMKISVGDTVVFDEVLNSKKAAVSNEKLSESETSAYYQIKIKLPKSVVAANAKASTVEASKKAVAVKFEGTKDSESAKVCKWLYTLKPYNTKNSLTDLTSSDVSLKKDGKSYSVTVPYTKESIKAKFSIADKSGYVALNDNAVTEDEEKAIPLTGKTTKVEIKVYAQDFTSYETYTLTIERDYSTLDLSDSLVYSFGFNDSTDGAKAVTKASVPSENKNANIKYTDGRTGKAIKLDGTFGLELGDANKLGDSYTIAFAMKPENVGGSVDPTLAAGTFSPEYWLNATFDAKLWSKSDAAGGYVDTTAANVYKAGKWQQVTIVVDGKKEGSSDGKVNGKLYVDGTLVSEGDVADKIMTNSGAKVYFGVNAWDAYFKGAVDDIMMFNRVLTGSEVQGIADGIINADSAGKADNHTAKKTGKVKKVVITKKGSKKQIKTVTVKRGKSVKLAAKVTVSGSASKKVKWSVSNKKYATVTSNGVVKIKNKKGTFIVTAASKSDKTKKAKVTVKVK